MWIQFDTDVPYGCLATRSDLHKKKEGLQSKDRGQASRCVMYTPSLTQPRVQGKHVNAEREKKIYCRDADCNPRSRPTISSRSRMFLAICLSAFRTSSNIVDSYYGSAMDSREDYSRACGSG